MCRASTAAASDDLSPGSKPFPSRIAIRERIARARPTPMLGIPTFAGIGIDNDRPVGCCAKLCNERVDQRRACAIDADTDRLRKPGNGLRALAKKFAMGNMHLIAAGEREPYGDFRMLREGLTDRFGFCK